jgi:two-component system cell cycle response regulator
MLERLKPRIGVIKVYVYLTNLVIFSLILLVPLGSYILTQNPVFLHPIHIGIAVIFGLLQLLVNSHLYKSLKRFLMLFGETVKDVSKKLKRTRTIKDLREIETTLEKLTELSTTDEFLSKISESVELLIKEISQVLELKNKKEFLFKNLTVTLDAVKISRVLLRTFYRTFNIPAGAVYLFDVKSKTYRLIYNFALKNIPDTLSEVFVTKYKNLSEDITVENLDAKVDLGLFEEPIDELWVCKLEPRRGKLLGFLFLAIDKRKVNSDRFYLFLEDVLKLIALIYENSLEYQKSLLLATTDPLTGLLNRAEGLRLLKKMLKTAEFEGKNVCLLVLDIDNFKKINDTYGHDAGDYVLKTIASIIKRTVRKNDLVIRWGGEEFLVAYYDIPMNKALEVADRIRRNIENAEIKLPEGEVLRITVSGGLACTLQKKTYNLDILFETADVRLYKAKRMGKNRIVAD